MIAKDMINKIILSTILCSGVILSWGQSLNSETEKTLTDGILNLNLGGKDNHVRIGGYVSAGGHFTEIKNDANSNGLNVDHAFFNVEGAFLHQKLGLFLQTDFTEGYPLLDAYASYRPVDNLVLTFGQKQTFTNTRDMMLRDQSTANGEHSVMSKSFNNSGRELGFYAEYRMRSNTVGADFGIAVTSGDGKNSFGSTSADVDCGGLKYGGRITIYPNGYFKRGNEYVFYDFARETSPKVAIGAAFSYNDGASNAVGEGHGDFRMYDKEGKLAYPDLRKFSADILLKWAGFTLLADYTNTTATKLQNLYTAASVASKLQPKEISQMLALGNGVDVQMGYITKNGWAFNTAYSYVKPEFAEVENSALRKNYAWDVGVAKYFCGNTLKLQLLGNYTHYRTVIMEPYKERSVKMNIQLLF